MDLDTLLGELGVTVEVGELPDGLWGGYSHAERRIVLLPGLGPTQQRSVLMHEIGHAVHGHRGTTPAQEREASHWAARRLISMPAFIAACQVSDTAQGIAHHLGVLPRDVNHFVDSLTEQERIHIHLHVNEGAA